MNTLLHFAQTHPGTAVAGGVALIVALYWLLNRKPATTKDAERRMAELREQGRDRYRELRPPQ